MAPPKYHRAAKSSPASTLPPLNSKRTEDQNLLEAACRPERCRSSTTGILTFELVQYYTTRTLAKILDIRPDSLRRTLSDRGHVYGIRPTKLPGGRNLWAAKEVSDLLSRCANGGLGKEVV